MILPAPTTNDLTLIAQIAELKLQLLQANQRYENANRLALSYMKEFEDRGLVYIAKQVET
jgi:hypothetical protein